MPRSASSRLPGFVLAVPAWLWLTVFFVVPFLQIAWFSLGEKPGMFGTHSNAVMSLERYAEAFSPTFFTIFRATLWMSVLGTIACLLIALPAAYYMALKVPAHRRGLLVALVMVPYWTSFLIRTIGWKVILSSEGALAGFLTDVGLVGDPHDLLNTRGAVLLGLIYNYLPLMILPLYVAFDRVDSALGEASKDLGAGRVRTFFQVTLPLARPGIIAGVILVFIPMMGDYVTPAVLGGAKGTMVGSLIASQFLTAQNWALGSAMAVVLILLTMLVVVLAIALLWGVGWLVGRRTRLVIGTKPGAKAVGTKEVATA
ncbi:ABC transporter permease [Nocardioides sp. NBC_00368]|uniref:ABC transporter permease n=1 Tax=Nocardioides sp. NBC_00368 TaxID=2976000 RepID=UPI002E1B4678